MTPSLFLPDSAPLFEKLLLEPLGSLVYHYLPEQARSTYALDRYVRGVMERSALFIASYVEMLCPRYGICLELGCGTAPCLKACLRIERVCVSLDSDEALVSAYVLPLLHAEVCGGVDRQSSQQEDAEVDEMASHNPYE